MFELLVSKSFDAASAPANPGYSIGATPQMGTLESVYKSALEALLYA